MALVDFTDGKSANATASGSYYELVPPNAFDDIVQNNWGWISGSRTDGIHWIQIDVESAVTVTQLRYIGTPEYSDQFLPIAWYLFGSNTGVFGGEETLISSQTGLTLSSYTWYEWDFSNSTAFRYYRLRLLQDYEGQGRQYVAAVEIELKGEEVIPDPPGNIQAVAGDEHNTISWDAAAGATSYNIYWDTETGVTKETGTKIEDVTSPYDHTELENGVEIFYVVTAENGAGESDESDEVSATPEAEEPMVNTSSMFLIL